MKNTIKALTLALMGLAVFAPAAIADWNPGDPSKMHWPQLPDLTPTGMDVLATRQPTVIGNGFKILADDWACTETGPVSDIHIWGSWAEDILPSGSPNSVVFKLSIHSDIPAGTLTPYSQPGAELWSATFTPGSFTVRPYATGVTELFYDPNIGQIIGSDSVVWQYNFTNLPNPYIQQQGTIYWLDVQALPQGDAYFGWKTTNPLETDHFLDDAVFADTAGFNGALVTPWAPMVYPSGHPYAGQSIDLAFVITPEPGSIALLATGAGVIGLRLIRRKRA